LETRIGNQYPTQSYVLPYTQSHGNEAVELYSRTGREAQEWQQLLLEDILAYNEDDLFVHTKYGYAVPRRNGKNEIVIIREMWGLMNGEHILHTAHRTSTSHSAWERLLDLLVMANIQVVSSYRASGKELIEIYTGGKIEFRTRTSKGGLGEGFDLLVIDEAQEYQDDQESALKYVVSDSKNPQTIFCGTPPTPVSAGTVFTKFRNDTLNGKSIDSAWAEWSVDEQKDPEDREFWYLTNPSLGTILSERKIQAEITSDDLDFNIQRLGYWIRYNLKSAISESDWDKMFIEKPKFKGKLFVGIKYGQDNTNVSLSVAVCTADSKIFIETIDCQPIRNGNQWITDFVRECDVQNVVIDGASGQNILAEELKANRIKPILPTVKEIIDANAIFEQAVFNKTMCHHGQPSLRAVATNCEHRNIGSSGGFGYRSLKRENDIVLLDSAVLAYWACSTCKPKKKQKISY